MSTSGGLKAEHRYHQSLQISERLGEPTGMASSYGQLGILAQALRDYKEAERRCQQSLQISERFGDQVRMATGYHQLGILAHCRGDYGEAERRIHQSLQINERLGNQAEMALSWSNLGTLAMERRQYAEATVWHICALLVRLRLQVPRAAYDARALAALRVRMGSDAFVAAASAVVDDTQLAEIQAILDSLGADDSGEPETE